MKMENPVAGVDLVGSWNNPGFFGLEMGGFDTFANVPQC